MKLRMLRQCFVLVLLAVFLVDPGTAQSSIGNPAAHDVCAPFKNPALRTAADAMCTGKLLAAFASLTNQAFRLPKPLAIVGIQCNQSNAFYDRDKTAVFICYELVDDIFRRLKQETRIDGNAKSELAAGAMFFLFSHELGHALIHLYNLPVLGREEDAADQIATFLLIVVAEHKPNVSQYWTVGAHWFFAKRTLFFKTAHFADEHSLNPQRQFNIACWIYGSNPSKYLSLAQYAKLPNNRAQRCPDEYKQMLNAAKQMLGPYINDPRNEPRPSDQSAGPSMAQRAAACHDQAQSNSLFGAEKDSFIQQCYQRNGVVVRQSR